MSSQYRTFKERTRLLFDEAVNTIRTGFRNDHAAATLPLEISPLEQRILMSASPMAIVGAEVQQETLPDSTACEEPEAPGGDLIRDISSADETNFIG